MTESQQQNSSTKVYYHLDDSMPYMSEVPVPLDRLTLADFKKVFNRRKGFSYFCKEWDPHLDREVKVEITSDRQRLHKSANGLVELFLLSQKCLSGLGGADTLPKARSGAKCSNSTENPMIPITGKAVQRLPKSGTGPMHASALALSSVASSELDVGGGQRVSMITAGGTEASSDVQTLISRRAGEHLAELYNSTSEDPYNNRTSISSSGIFHRLPGAPMPSAESTIESCLDRSLLPSTYKHKRPRKQRYRKPYVPSTISSESESSYSLPRIEEVKLRLQEAPLGIAVASQDGSIFIYNIQTESAAEKCGQLEIGDQIVQIDDTRFEDLNEKQALELLRKLSTAKKTITMYVAKRGRATGGESSEEQKSDALSLLCETQQLDISQWVESTTKQNGVEKFRPFVDVPPAEPKTVPTVSQAQQQTKNQPALSHRPQAMDTSQGQQEMKAMAMDETSDEERAAYMDRRNGVGARLVPAIKQIRTKQQQIRAKEERKKQLESSAATSRPIVLGAEPTVPPPIPVPTASAGGGQTPAPAPKAQQPLHAAMEPTVILRRMVDPDSRLTIRDRKWLKIPVPMSFIGEEMVDWLVENVQGFRNRKSARAFASRLMATGLIKHVANIHSFSEKCYYIFDDAIIADRLRLDEERLNGGQQQAKHPKLEVTATGANAAKSSGSGAPESNTEITYMSSNPSSPFFGPAGVQQNTVAAAAGPPPLLVFANNPRYVQGPGILNKQPQQKGPQTKQQSQANANQMNNNAIPLRTLNPPKFGHQLPVWPISPIHAFNRSQQRAAGIEQIREECESPEATNDYASMIQGEVNCGAQFDAQFDGLIQQQQKHQSQQPTILNNRPTTMKNENNLIASEFAATKLKKAQQKAQQNLVASLLNNNDPTNSSSTAIVAPAALLPAPPPPHRQQFASNNNNNNQQPKQ